MDTQNRRRRRRRRRIRIQPRFIIVLLLFLVVVVLAVLAIRGIGGGRQEQQEGSGGGFLSGLFSTPTPEPTPVPTPSPSPTPVPRFDTPHAVDASNPANWGYTTDVEVNGAVVESYTRAEPIYFDYDTPYTNVNGIVTFRGDNYRSGAAYGTASISSRQLSELWSFDIGQMAKPGGSGNWSGQRLGGAAAGGLLAGEHQADHEHVRLGQAEGGPGGGHPRLPGRQGVLLRHRDRRGDPPGARHRHPVQGGGRARPARLSDPVPGLRRQLSGGPGQDRPRRRVQPGGLQLPVHLRLL